MIGPSNCNQNRLNLLKENRSDYFLHVLCTYPSNGSIDERRLPKAINCIVANYRGLKVGKIPDRHIHVVLVRLEAAARNLGKMPDQNSKTAPAYYKLNEALAQQ